MTVMIRRLGVLVVVAAWSGVISPAAAGQALSVLHIRVVLPTAAGQGMPVPRHALLISANPPSAAPRRILTGLDGTADVRLRPGNYAVESDAPVAFEGKAYEWVQMVDVFAGRDSVLELTADNAEILPVGSAASNSASPIVAEADPSALLGQWQNSVVGVWSQTAHATGFVIGANGLIVTGRQGLGPATAVEVQVSQSIKVTGTVLATDPDRNVAILRIDPAIAASLPVIPLGCGPAAPPAVTTEQRIVSIDAPLRQLKGTSSGSVAGVAEHEIESDLRLPSGSAGGPVFTAAGVIGITSMVDDSAGQRRPAVRIVPIADVCAVVESAQKKLTDAATPNGAHLPVEPVRPFPVDAFKDRAPGQARSLAAYQVSSSDFDIAFLTPPVIYDAQHQLEEMSRRNTTRASLAGMDQALANGLMDFSNWSEYVASVPPVLIVRVTPRQVESFWTKVARGAVMTQGVSLPPIKRFKSGFARMRAFCGDAEVTPIHPFKLERRISESDAIYEGLYVFEPGALGPQCGAVKLVLYSEKEPDKADTQVVDAKVVQQAWQDFAAYRDLK
jgi:hypothetical protein